MGFWLREEWNNEPPSRSVCPKGFRRKERQGQALCQLASFIIGDRT
ncbi:hypothetical protein PN465_03580 [Nodularia spumigena CS-584]|nr:hypothetical protein [Nodularia spumigena]AHJ28886.1 hypothetical protein NSP_25580 [Nodularia spumigena CCY9414]MDB9381323.1 hypothetical protein [Nodularia spumigena CS-584]MEA5556006.1 hypothetical protein [Nodularia spumigena CH309]